MKWRPDLYDKFQSERLMPMKDIVPFLEIRHNLEIIDLGCGSGALTECLAKMFPSSSIVTVPQRAF
ncbi:methyltransferase [Nodosilinea sp. LEGE 07088]|uniref:rRNA adenine N-6-methyltransferase family protein n=1 Tax=Nodosilinea sp. LEGE 07088 TaxID=2777968 RepID=UPI001880FBD2|nr:methyltransferase [Nodosilinea sp. LEGE 07088]